ncbi:MAG: rhomboid family intramembrane serine protease [Crocinitomicaceae bacterium]
MQTERTFLEDIKHQFRNGNMSVRLIFINIIIFLTIRIIDVFIDLSSSTGSSFVDDFVNPIFALQTDFYGFITHPWALITNMFTHYSFLHLAFNMIFLYFVGKLFEQLFNQRRLLYTYLLGGIFGGLLEIIAHAIFPKLQMTSDFVIGASGSIMALFVAIAFYRPNLKVNLLGLFPVRLIILAGLYILSDILGMGDADGTAHFAHIGGAILGMISVQNPQSPTNIIARAERLGAWLKSTFSRSSQPRMKVKKGGHSAGRPKSDEQFVSEAKERQDTIDKILDKISKSGYESLTKKEKEFLFNQSKK